MSPHDDTYDERRQVFLAKVHRAAARAIADGDVWKDQGIPSIPAERVIRHMYDPKAQRWHSDETIVKIEKEPFTHGAMRYCFRMKKIATPPQNATNHRFHRYGWSRALNYVAKAYINPDGSVDSSEEAKDAVRNDIVLQYEAARWADEFNRSDPPKKINFIRAYAMEFPDRPGSPLFAVERFIAGDDYYGAGFTKHNTNSGFVDLDLHRVTPQVFSAHSFYASRGTRLVADIQGIGDLFTDPQVLSSDYRYGDGDLGPRGMALFFKTFRHNSFSDLMGIPIFPLSRNELKHQAKYVEDESTLSDEMSIGTDEDSFAEDITNFNASCKFAQLDLNRQKRKSALMTPLDAASTDTEKRSNLTEMRESVSECIKASIRASAMKKSMSAKKPIFHRSRSDVDEVTACLKMATRDKSFGHKAFHRLESGEVKKRSSDLSNSDHRKRRPTVMLHTCDIIMPNEETKMNLGRVHYHLACLHGAGRFPEIVPALADAEGKSAVDAAPAHDVFSVLFHLCHASSLRNVPACLALARVRAGLDTTVSDLLKTVVPVDFDGAKDLLRRAMEDPHEDGPPVPSGPRAAAGCLLLQILEDEGDASDITLSAAVEETLELMAAVEQEEHEAAARRAASAGPGEGFGDLEGAGGGPQYEAGDKVEANFAMEGTFYSGVVVSVENNFITVLYDDDGYEETLASEHVRLLEGQKKKASPTEVSGGEGIGSGEGGGDGENGGACNRYGPMTDEEAIGAANDDERCLYEPYLLKAKLAELKAKAGKVEEAAALYEEAADGAMDDGKMKTASEWSCKASGLMS